MSQQDPSTRVSSKQEAAKASGSPKLVVTSGPDTGKGFALTKAMMTVGRHPTNDIVLRDEEISGVHMEITRDDATSICVRDTGSRNGTWMGAHRIVEIFLSQGAEFRAGTTQFRLEFDALATDAPASKRNSFRGFVGESKAMREVFATLERVAPKDIPILFEGETGVGKDLLARGVFDESPRAGKAFIVMDPSLYADDVFERAILGVGDDEGGAGILDQASGGVVYIDGVEGLSPAKQARLLSVMDRKVFVRVGGRIERPLNVRFLSSSKRDIRPLIEAGQFRDDLYYRLSAVRISIPPLRDRAEDIACISQAILDDVSGTHRLTPDAIHSLSRFAWPGNVRELKSVLIWGSSVAPTERIAPEHLSPRAAGAVSMETDFAPTFVKAKEEIILSFEKAYLTHLMRRVQGNLSMASRESGLTRHYLRDLLRKHELYGVAWDESE